MYYSIQHTTRFRYEKPISESVMEVRKQPRSEGPQRCLRFDLQINPRAQVFNYRDHLGNTVHHFDIPRSHAQLAVTGRAVVEMAPHGPVPRALEPGAWTEIDRIVETGDHYFEITPSRYARPTELLREFAAELGCAERRADPLSLLHEINAAIHDYFDYAPQSTRVDSPIDDALRAHKGVCQDFAHIMITLVREYLRLPCRYVSGYLFHRVENNDRSAQDATHAWVEALLPRLGWVGFDPTNNLIAGERHIRVAAGRDYSDVTPTRGIFKGETKSELSVAVKVEPCEAPPAAEDLEVLLEPVPPDLYEQQQQQQQQ